MAHIPTSASSVSADGLSCCVANGFLDAQLTRSNEVHGRKHSQPTQCAKQTDQPSVQYPWTLGPPRSSSQVAKAGRAQGQVPTSMWMGGWAASGRYNELAGVYHHRCAGCYNRCSSTRCGASSASSSGPCVLPLPALSATGPRSANLKTMRSAGRGDASNASARALKGKCTWQNGCCQRHPRFCTFFG